MRVFKDMAFSVHHTEIICNEYIYAYFDRLLLLLSIKIPRIFKRSNMSIYEDIVDIYTSIYIYFSHFYGIQNYPFYKFFRN